jgi:hypothetical protein
MRSNYRRDWWLMLAIHVLVLIGAGTVVWAVWRVVCWMLWG